MAVGGWRWQWPAEGGSGSALTHPQLSLDSFAAIHSLAQFLLIDFPHTLPPHTSHLLSFSSFFYLFYFSPSGPNGGFKLVLVVVIAVVAFFVNTSVNL